MLSALDRPNRMLLEDWQRDFPLEPRPFATIAEPLGIGEAEVIDRLRKFIETGTISRVGATCRPNTVGASTLAAISASESRIEDVARIIGDEPGVNHSYLRENHWNLWFVATGPDRDAVDNTLGRIERRSGLRVLDLPLVKAFNVDLGFAFDGTYRHEPMTRNTDAAVFRPADRPIVQALSSGLDITERPFGRLADSLGRTEAEVIERIRALAAAGILSRVGVIVRHRALGWRSNAMVVWQLPEADIDQAGRALTALPGVTLCYQRRPVPVLWPYTLYCMIHARNRSEAFSVLAQAREIEVLANVHHEVLFSIRCFKQRGAMIDNAQGTAA